MITDSDAYKKNTSHAIYQTVCEHLCSYRFSYPTPCIWLCKHFLLSTKVFSISLHQVPSVLFDFGRPKLVVVLIYQRCGSSFFGQVFNTNPDVFYLYEPLYLYGTKEGWKLPSNITSYWDGTEKFV